MPRWPLAQPFRNLAHDLVSVVPGSDLGHEELYFVGHFSQGIRDEEESQQSVTVLFDILLG